MKNRPILRGNKYFSKICKVNNEEEGEGDFKMVNLYF